MFIVHVGWDGPDGPGYTIGGVYSTKALAMAGAKKVAESALCNSETDTMEEIADGYVVTVEEVMGVCEGSTEYVQVSEVVLDTGEWIIGEC